MYIETSDFQCQRQYVSNGSIKCPIGKSSFAVNLQSKLFRPTIFDADTGSLKSLHTLFDIYLDHKLAKFEPNRMIRIFKTIFTKR